MPAADGEADGGHRPDAGSRGQPFHRAAAVHNGARPQKTDTGNHSGSDLGRITADETVYRDYREQSCADGNQHLGA